MKSTTTSNSPRGESIWRRVLLALPLLALFFIARTVLTANVSKYLHLIEETVRTGFIDNGGQQVPLRKVYTGLEGLDNFLAIFVAFFTPALAGLDHTSTPGPKLDEYGILYAPQRLQTITLIADFATLNVILALESCRRGNSKTIASIPTIFLLAAQLLGAGQITPLFYFLTYISVPPRPFTSRTVPIRYAKTLLPALLLGYIIPSIGCFYPSSTLSTKQAWNYGWQLYPLWIALFHYLFSLIPSTTSSTTKEENSLPSLRLTYAALFLLSAGTYIYIFSVTPVPFSQIFFSDINFFTWDKEVSGVAEGTALFLKWDEIFIVLGAAYWILLHFADLKREGRVKAGWGSILAAFVGVGVVCGPGAGMAVMWWWREEALAGGKDEGKEE